MLEGLLKRAETESHQQRRNERLWSRLGVFLGFGGAIGAGVGGLGAIAGDLSGGPQIGVILLAFIGAGLSAAAGTLRAPEKAEIAHVRSTRLDAYARRLETVLAVDLETSGEIGGPGAQREILEAALRGYDEIVGVEIPTGIQLTRDPRLMRVFNEDLDKQIAGPVEISSDSVQRALPAAQPNASLRNMTLENADLSGANLSGMDLSGVNLAGARLTRANLTGANLDRANLADTDLTDADLTDASLQDANLAHATVVHARFVRARLYGANFDVLGIGRADLREAMRDHRTEFPPDVGPSLDD